MDQLPQFELVVTSKLEGKTFHQGDDTNGADVGARTLRFQSREASFDNGNGTLDACFSPVTHESSFVAKLRADHTEDVDFTADAMGSRASQRPYALEYAHQKQTRNELKPRRRVKATRQDSALSHASK
jgi:hypothetical protein